MTIALDFNGKTAFVVGGSSGIGNGIAQSFRACGASVYVAGTRPKPEDYTAEDGDLTGLSYVQLDATDRSALAEFVPPFEQLDILILSQGTVLYGQEEFGHAGWDRVMAVNINSVMDCATRFHEMLKHTRGVIIIISSTAGYLSTMGNPAYAASKAAARHLTATLGEAWIRDGVRVNGIAPGFVHTKLTSIILAHPKRAAAAVSDIPIGRVGEPSEMGGVALFLASPLSSYVVGQTIIVDGGMILSR